MKKQARFFPLVTLALIATSCVTKEVTRSPAESEPGVATETVSNFPEIGTDDGSLLQAIEAKLEKDASTLSIEDAAGVAERLRHYFSFLGLSARDFQKAARATSTASTETAVVPNPTSATPNTDDSGEDDGDKTPSNLKAIQRIFASSTQFLFCSDLSDWDCLESPPKLSPSAVFRKESRSGLGQAIPAGKTLNMDVFFTEGWDGSPRAGLVDRFAERLHAHVGKSLSLAMYGIDDIEGSMKPVYDELKNFHQDPNMNFRSVVDVAGLEHAEKPWLFDYVDPVGAAPDLAGRWLFGSSTASGNGMHATFQYDGTPDFIREMNGNIRSSVAAKVRVEWPTSHIMHNKFAVLEDASGKKSVWTGTANISNHCMGTEANSNMAVFIQNDSVAQAYLDEFNLMYEFDPALNLKSKLVVGSLDATDPKPLKVGRFHHNKMPISQRSFTFEDGTRLRVHFAPTDDAEHRVILPMLLSAKAGDEIRVSMFGGTGYEIVRAFQYAAAKGASIRIVYDRQLGHGQTSWIRDPILNLNKPNPYLKLVPAGARPGTIQVRLSTWAGKNHYKVGSLNRRHGKGEMVPEEIILGSQNWSSGGNDFNDENLISIQNLKTGVPAAKLFNDEFDRRLWMKSVPERKSGKRAET